MGRSSLSAQVLTRAGCSRAWVLTEGAVPISRRGGRRTHLVLEAMKAVVLDEEARVVELLGRVDLLHLRRQVVAHGLQLLLDLIMPCLCRHHEGNLPVLVALCEVRLPQTRRVLGKAFKEGLG